MIIKFDDAIDLVAFCSDLGLAAASKKHMGKSEDIKSFLAAHYAANWMAGENPIELDEKLVTDFHGLVSSIKNIDDAQNFGIKLLKKAAQKATNEYRVALQNINKNFGE